MRHRITSHPFRERRFRVLRRRIALRAGVAALTFAAPFAGIGIRAAGASGPPPPVWGMMPEPWAAVAAPWALPSPWGDDFGAWNNPRVPPLWGHMPAAWANPQQPSLWDQIPAWANTRLAPVSGSIPAVGGSIGHVITTTCGNGAVIFMSVIICQIQLPAPAA